ncbi:MAG: pilus assembly protein TadB, partial [Gammaproteobacteria bacterium]|nr:pilus assembly protein TadB [Gammaproteobacteria bacterium]
LPDPVSTEFRQVFEEQKFGLPLRDSLMAMADRIPLVDTRIFVTAVLIQRESGGSLAEILDNLSYTIRERFKIRRQLKV